MHDLTSLISIEAWKKILSAPIIQMWSRTTQDHEGVNQLTGRLPIKDRV